MKMGGRRPLQDSRWESGGLHFNSGRVNGEKYKDSKDTQNKELTRYTNCLDPGGGQGV